MLSSQSFLMLAMGFTHLCPLSMFNIKLYYLHVHFGVLFLPVTVASTRF